MLGSYDGLMRHKSLLYAQIEFDVIMKVTELFELI